MYGFDADRDRVEIALAREAVAVGKPLLAICRGHQLLNVALGGTLWEDIETRMPGARRHNYYLSHPRDLLAHDVTIAPGSLLGRQLGCETIGVNSLHHQGVRSLAPGMEAVALAEDGLVEAAEVRGHPFALSVQWHPESLLVVEPRMRRLFEGLVEAALAQNVPV
jgi:putative glutamine amidotransferase